MADAHSRSLERQAAAQGDVNLRVAALRERVRRQDDACGPWECRWCRRAIVRVEVPCGNLDGVAACRGMHHVQCNGTGRAPWPWTGGDGRLALAAYGSDEAAREMIRPPATLCLDCWLSGVDTPQTFRCPAENLDTFLDGLTRWPGALLRASIAAGWVALSGWEEGGGVCAPRSALDAAADHALCGCKASRKAWDRASITIAAYTQGLDDTLWVPRPPMDHATQTLASARIAGEEPVREAVRAAVIAYALRGEVARG